MAKGGPLLNVDVILFLCARSPRAHKHVGNCLWNLAVSEMFPDTLHARSCSSGSMDEQSPAMGVLRPPLLPELESAVPSADSAVG